MRRALVRKKALCYLSVTLNAITMKKALFISLCALLLAGTGCKKNAEPEPHKVIVTSVSVKENTEEDKDEFPYIVSKN